MKKILLALALISAAQVITPWFGRDRYNDDYRYRRGPGLVGGALNVAADAVDTTADVVTGDYDDRYYRDGRRGWFGRDYDRDYRYDRYGRPSYRHHFWN